MRLLPAVVPTEGSSAPLAGWRQGAILARWPCLLRLIPVTSRTLNGSSLGLSCPSWRAGKTVEGARGGRTVPCSMASCGSLGLAPLKVVALGPMMPPVWCPRSATRATSRRDSGTIAARPYQIPIRALAGDCPCYLGRTRAISSSNQFWITTMCLTGKGGRAVSRSIRKRWPSALTSYERAG